MGRAARYENEDLWADFELALSRCVTCDPLNVRTVLEEYGLTVVRMENVEHAGAMLRDTLRSKPSYKISFVKDASDSESRAVAVDFAWSQIEAEAKALLSFPLYRVQGATSWRITGSDELPVAVGPTRPDR